MSQTEILIVQFGNIQATAYPQGVFDSGNDRNRFTEAQRASIENFSAFLTFLSKSDLAQNGSKPWLSLTKLKSGGRLQ